MPKNWSRWETGKPLVLDGALGTQLEALIPRESPFHPKNDKLWSAKVLLDQPRLVEDVHYQYLESGSDILLTNTYQASYDGLVKYGNKGSDEEVFEVWQSAVVVAKNAIKRYRKENRGDGSRSPRPLVICGSIGPYGAFLADGSEYTGNYGGIPNFQLEQFHVKMMQFFLQSPYVELVGLETIPSFQELKVLLNLFIKLTIANRSRKQLYISFSFKDSETLCDGTSMEKVMLYLNNKLSSSKVAKNSLLAVGCNCVDYRLVNDIIDNISKYNHHQIPLIAYPNFGGTYDTKTGFHEAEKDNHSWNKAVREWLDKGILITGGCCCTGPQEIKSISEQVSRLN